MKIPLQIVRKTLIILVLVGCSAPVATPAQPPIATPDSTAEAYSNRGRAYAYKGDYDRAITEFNRAIQLQPDYAGAYNRRGAAYGFKGDYDRAIADFDKAIQLQPDYAEALSGRGAAYLGKGDFDVAIADFDKAIQLQPDCVVCYLGRGLAYNERGGQEQAIADFKEVLKLGTDPQMLEVAEERLKALATNTSAPTRTPTPPAATPSSVLPISASARPVAGATRVREKDGAVMVFVPAGEFLMGSLESEQDWEQPQHTVHVDDFWIDRTEVTNEQYRRCVDAGACQAPTNAEDDLFNGADKPVVGVSWYDARAYCKWLGEATDQEYRLPTEAEWEKAARGTDGREYPWGDVFDGSKLNFCDVNCAFGGEEPSWKDRGADDGHQYTAPVGSYPAGASPYGVLDMAGNVYEWTQSRWGPGVGKSDFRYPYDPNDGREDLEAEGLRALRGGSWGDWQKLCRSAFRLGFPATNRDDYLGGFRVVAPSDSP